MESKAKLEHIVHDQDASFRFFLIEGPQFNHPYHYHPEIELTLILDSTGMRLVGDEFQPFASGDLCLLGENLPHLYRNDAPAAEPAPDAPVARALVLQFPRDLGGGFLDNTAELQPVSELLDRAALGLRFDRETTRLIGELMRQLLTAGSYTRIALLVNILGVLARAGGEPIASAGYRPNLNDHQSERISRACHYIMEHFHEKVTLEQTAQLVGMSPSAFTRFFQRATNQSFRDFLTGIRLGHARRLLLETDLPITEIALSSGFNTVEHFNRRFKKSLEVSPKKFRKRAPVG